jgi:hypothetical protein
MSINHFAKLIASSLCYRCPQLALMCRSGWLEDPSHHQWCVFRIESMGDSKCEGSLFIEIDDKWKNLFCWIRNGQFQAFEKQRVISVSNQSNTRQAILEVRSSQSPPRPPSPHVSSPALSSKSTIYL